jgi:uncharacterized membrane protein YraQ (UPF0718 family)
MWSVLQSIVGDRIFIAVTIIAAAAAALLYELHGPEAIRAALSDDVRVFTLLLLFVPPVLLLSAFVEVMLPRSLVERWLGVGSGIKGIMVATFAGAFTPGGPFLAFPLVLALYRAGADWAPLIAYITSWSILSVARVMVFEIPLVGVELVSVRYIACLILPPIAGLSARYVARLYRPPPGLRG